MLKKIKVTITILIIIISNSTLSASAIGTDNYEYIYGKTNLLLIGANDKKDSPCNFLMILTIDSINKKLYLTSLRKDCIISPYNKTLYNLYIENNEDYLICLIKKAFNMHIDNYVVINKNALKIIVDSTNTIKLNNTLTSGNEIVSYLENINYLDIKHEEKIQRDVIQEFLYGFARLPFSKYPYVVKESFPFVEINLTPFQMLSLGFTALSLKNYTALQYSITQ